jgi:hypothetical protein
MRKTIAALCVLMMFTAVCLANFESGTSLLNKWKEYKKQGTGIVGFNESDAAFYTGYVEGIADSNQGVLFTIPENVTAQQVLGTVGKWLEDHPAELKKPADFLVTQALRSAYPLSEGK